MPLCGSYNQESQFYGVFNSNHAEHAASYFPPIEQWMPAARLSAQAHAAKGGLVCPLNALHYSCHLAPWGYQSGDQSEYMHWCVRVCRATQSATVCLWYNIMKQAF